MTQDETREALVGSLAEKLSARGNAAAVFGAPIERGGATVIPVAQVRIGFGGGGGSRGEAESAAERGAGSGGGGGMRVEPLGFIQMKEGAVCFHRIRGRMGVLRGLLGVAVLAAAVLAGLRPLARMAALQRG